MGYTSSDWKEDRDNDELLSDEDELQEEADLIDKILHSNEELTFAEMETVSYSTKLRDVYNDRWWSIDSETYFAHHDSSATRNKAGIQLYY